MIENRKQFEYSIESLAKMYGLRDRIAVQVIGDPDTRDDEVDGVNAMICKIEGEVAEYLATHVAGREEGAFIAAPSPREVGKRKAA